MNTNFPLPKYIHMEIQKIFSSYDDYGYEEDRIYSVLMDEEELCLLESLYSKDDEPKLKTSDKVNLWALKHLSGKKDRDAIIEAYDGPEGKGHKLAKRNAKKSGIATGAIAIPTGVVLGKIYGGNKGAAIGGALGAGYTGLTAGASYAGSRAGIAINKKLRKHSSKIDMESQRSADLAKVASGKMTKEEFAKKYNL